MRMVNILIGTVGALLVGAILPATSAEMVEPRPDEAALIDAALPGTGEAASPRKARRLLVFYRAEGYVHGCILKANHAIRRMGENTGAYTAEFSDEMAAFTDGNLSRYDAILFNNTSRLVFADDPHRKALLAFIEKGGGIIGIHAASDNFYEWEAGCAMLGGQFDGHPWTADGTWAVKLDEPDHPANAPFGRSGFWINDEIYQVKGPYSRDTHRVLLSLDMSKEINSKLEGIKRTDNDFPITWLKYAGKARVFYCSLGHNDHIYWNPKVLRHYLAGIQWAMGDRDLPDQPSATLNPRPQPALAPESVSPKP